MAGPWRPLARRLGGTVATLATARVRDGEAVFAATAAGAHRSADGGRTWTRLGADGLSPPVEVVAPSPDVARDRTIFAGTPTGLHRSSDDGATWQLVLTGARILTIALPADFGETGLLFVGTEADGILRSEDRGRSWIGANPGLTDLTVLALALSPRFAVDHTAFAATPSGLYRTRNGGRAWREVELPDGEVAVQCLAVSPGFADDRLVLAGLEEGGLLRSDDGGASWEPVPAFAGRGVTAIVCSQADRGRVVIAAATADGVRLSDDGATTWRAAGDALGPALSLAFVSERAGQTLLAGLPRSGVARFDPAGGIWNPANQGLEGSLLVDLAISPDFAHDRTVLAAGLEDGIAVSTDGGATWRSGGLDEVAAFDLAMSPTYDTDRTIFAATATGLSRSVDGGASWQSVGPGAASGPAVAVATGPALEGGRAPVVAALADGLLLSEDGGSTWRPGESPAPGAEVVSLGLGAVPTPGSILLGAARPLGEAEAGGQVAYELTLWRSIDAGRSWQRRLVEHGPRALAVLHPPGVSIDEGPFVGVGSRVLRPLGRAEEVRGGERRPIWRSATLPDRSASVLALAASPRYDRDSTVFAATSRGVYVSRDGGESFARWDEGLEPVPILALAVSPEYGRDRLVYALALGGTIWHRADD